jgi:hypothetical protein
MDKNKFQLLMLINHCFWHCVQLWVFPSKHIFNLPKIIIVIMDHHYTTGDISVSQVIHFIPNRLFNFYNK